MVDAVNEGNWRAVLKLSEMKDVVGAQSVPPCMAYL